MSSLPIVEPILMATAISNLIDCVLFAYCVVANWRLFRLHVCGNELEGLTLIVAHWKASTCAAEDGGSRRAIVG